MIQTPDSIDRLYLNRIKFPGEKIKTGNPSKKPNLSRIPERFETIISQIKYNELALNNKFGESKFFIDKKK